MGSAAQLVSERPRISTAIAESQLHRLGCSRTSFRRRSRTHAFSDASAPTALSHCMRPLVHWVRIVPDYCIYPMHMFVQQTSPPVLLDSYLLLVGDARCSVSVRLGAVELLFAFAQSPASENSSAEVMCERLRDAVARVCGPGARLPTSERRATHAAAPNAALPPVPRRCIRSLQYFNYCTFFRLAIAELICYKRSFLMSHAMSDKRKGDGEQSREQKQKSRRRDERQRRRRGESRAKPAESRQ